MGDRRCYAVDLADLDYDDPVCDRRPSDVATERMAPIAVSLPPHPASTTRHGVVAVLVVVTVLTLAAWAWSLPLGLVTGLSG